jgi:hypothetical protein
LNKPKVLDQYPTRQEARDALGAAGYTVGFSSPGRPELWINLRDHADRVAIQRVKTRRDGDVGTFGQLEAGMWWTAWHIMPYPEPSSATPDQVKELELRDGKVLHGGELSLDQLAEDLL